MALAEQALGAALRAAWRQTFPEFDVASAPTYDVLRVFDRRRGFQFGAHLDSFPARRSPHFLLGNLGKRHAEGWGD